MKTIGAFGDSLMKGVIYKDESYKILQTSFHKLCEESLGIKIENKAKFGSTVTKGEATIERNLDSLKDNDGKYVVLGFGGNDCDFNWKEISENPTGNHLPQNTISDFRTAYGNIIQEIKKIGKIPVLLSLPPIDSVKFFNHVSAGLSKENIRKWMHGDKQLITNWHERYNIEVFKLATGYAVPIIDITSVFLEERNYTRFLCDDGIHPNEEGHRLIANTIIAYVKKKNIEL